MLVESVDGSILALVGLVPKLVLALETAVVFELDVVIEVSIVYSKLTAVADAGKLTKSV